MIRNIMNRRRLLQKISRTVLGVGVAVLLPGCSTSGSGEVSSTGSLPPATKEAPFVNSLGMKFVPVPGTNILMCTTETTVAQYRAASLGYQAPNFSQSGNHPAVNMEVFDPMSSPALASARNKWSDPSAANAPRNDPLKWCQWISAKEGRQYRLPTMAEWSAAVGGNEYPWGNQWPAPGRLGNYMGQEMRSSAEAVRLFQSVGVSQREFALIKGFSDTHVFTAPVASYPPNSCGIYDLGGNVWEICEDNANSFLGRWKVRGGSWAVYNPGIAKSSFASAVSPGQSGFSYDVGFRCVIAK